MSNLSQIVADNLIKLRKEAGLSQLDLVAYSDVAPEIIYNIEHGTGNPELQTLDKIADALGVPISELFEEQTCPALIDVLSEFLWENSQNKAKKK